MIRTIPNWKVDIRLVHHQSNVSGLAEVSNVTLTFAADNLMEVLGILGKMMWFPREVTSVYIELDNK